MRTTLAIGLIALLIGGAAAGAPAAAQTAAPGTAEQKLPVEQPAKAAQKTRRDVGTVKAVDATAKTLTVETKSGDATIAIGDKTTIKRGKNTVKLEDLKAGDRVTVVYAEQDGKHVARSITLRAQ